MCEEGKLELLSQLPLEPALAKVGGVHLYSGSSVVVVDDDANAIPLGPLPPPLSQRKHEPLPPYDSLTTTLLHLIHFFVIFLLILD